MARNGSQKGEVVLVAQLAAGATIRDAAKSAGVGERTVYRRLDDTAFQHKVNRARAAMLERALGALSEASIEASATLRSLLYAESDMARLGAARSILTLTLDLRSQVELVERMAALEEALERQQAAQGRGTA